MSEGSVGNSVDVSGSDLLWIATIGTVRRGGGTTSVCAMIETNPDCSTIWVSRPSG